MKTTYKFKFPVWFIKYLQLENHPKGSPSNLKGANIMHEFEIQLLGYPPQILIEDTVTENLIANTPLTILEPSLERREFMTEVARIEIDNGTATDVPKIRKMIMQPGEVESVMLGHWNGFLLHCRIPGSFQIPERAPLSLGDLMHMRQTGHGGYVDTFANRFPWATRQMLSQARKTGNGTCEDFQMIAKGSSQEMTGIAAKCLCCSKDSGCLKALEFANVLSRKKYRNNQYIDDLLGDLLSRQDRQRRSLLFAIHSDDPELLAHIGPDMDLTKRQMETAIQVIYQYGAIRYPDSEGLECFKCAYYLAQVIIRMMIRDRQGFDPVEINHETVIRGLIALSCDCLAAFVENGPQEPDPDLSTIDLGVLAFVSYIGSVNPPHLTIRQFIRFAEVASRRNWHQAFQSRSVDKENDIVSSWPGPIGWTSALSHIGGINIRFLNQTKNMMREGEEMEHCLRNGEYNRACLLGERYVFSMQKDENARATLAIKPVLDHQNRRNILRYEIDQLQGPNNTQPLADFSEASDELLGQLNRSCPSDIDRSELDRRDEVRKTLERIEYNPDVNTARKRWSEYRKNLPKSLSCLDMEEFVECFLEENRS